mgnify:CR=1 FL=1
MEKRHEIRLSGYGGQGIILAGYILAQAASIHEKRNAVFIQDYGPEARGGACRADIVISDKPVRHPYIGTPSILVAMSQQAYDKYFPANPQNTLVLIEEELVKPQETRGAKLLAFSPRRIAEEELGRPTVANIVMLGVLTAVTGVVSPEAMKKSILSSVPKNTEEVNLKAFERGYQYGREKFGST